MITGMCIKGSDQAAVAFFAKCDKMFENAKKKLLPVAKMRQLFLITVFYMAANYYTLGV